MRFRRKLRKFSRWFREPIQNRHACPQVFDAPSAELRLERPGLASTPDLRMELNKSAREKRVRRRPTFIGNFLHRMAKTLRKILRITPRERAGRVGADH
jgi:hypothetical protein